MKIPNVKEVQKLRDNAKSDSRVQSMLKVIIEDVMYAASRGESSVLMTGNDFIISPQNAVLNLACNCLVEEGYKVNRYDGEESEATCFGTGYVSVRGIKVSW